MFVKEKHYKWNSIKTHIKHSESIEALDNSLPQPLAWPKLFLPMPKLGIELIANAIESKWNGKWQFLVEWLKIILKNRGKRTHEESFRK